MSIRLQVIMDEVELAAIRDIAARHGLTVSEWVRQTLRGARREEASGDVETRLAAVRGAARHSFPAPDVEQMLAEIEAGYQGQ
jgi:hypothetical protein